MTNIIHLLTAVLATYIFGTVTSNQEEPINYTERQFTLCGTQIPDEMRRICPGNYREYGDKRSTGGYSKINELTMNRGAHFRLLKKWQQRLLFDLINVKILKKRGRIATTCCEKKNCTFIVLGSHCNNNLDARLLNRVAQEYFSRTSRPTTPLPELTTEHSLPEVQEPSTTTSRHGLVETVTTNSIPETYIDVREISFY